MHLCPPPPPSPPLQTGIIRTTRTTSTRHHQQHNTTSIAALSPIPQYSTPSTLTSSLNYYYYYYYYYWIITCTALKKCSGLPKMTKNEKIRGLLVSPQQISARLIQFPLYSAPLAAPYSPRASCCSLGLSPSSTKSKFPSPIFQRHHLPSWGQRRV